MGMNSEFYTIELKAKGIFFQSQCFEKDNTRIYKRDNIDK